LAVLTFIPLADVCLYGSEALGFGFALLMLITAGAALGLSRLRGHVVAGIVLAAPSIVWTAVEPGWANVFSVFAGLCLLAWTDRASDAAWGLFRGILRALSAPFRLLGYLRQVLSAAPLHKAGQLGRIIRLGLPAVLVSGLFLVLLGFGNAALAQWTNVVWTEIKEFLSTLVFPDMTRVVFWVFAAGCGAMLLVPAWRCSESTTEGDFLKKRFGPGAEARRLTLQWIFVLAGVNIVFLLTNTLDVIYLWIRRSPPQGVSTTEYLYGGVYGLIFATIIAGLILALVFNHGSAVRGSRWLKGLGMAWVVQNVFLIAGVDFRLWLHLDRFCLSPRRVEVMFFLVLVVAGFVLLSVFMLRDKTFRWLVGGNVLAVCILFFVVQFLDVRRWCVDSAIARWQENPRLELDGDFWKSVDLPGWRLLEVMAKSDRDDMQTQRARSRWEELIKHLHNPKACDHLSWKDSSWYAITESRDLCRAAGVPDDAADARLLSRYWLNWSNSTRQADSR
jgi:hypothetical protein